MVGCNLDSFREVPRADPECLNTRAQEVSGSYKRSSYNQLFHMMSQYLLSLKAFCCFQIILIEVRAVVSKHNTSIHQICMELSRYIPANLSGLYASDPLVWLSESFKELLCVLWCAYMYTAEHLLISVPAEPLCSNDSCFFKSLAYFDVSEHVDVALVFIAEA